MLEEQWSTGASQIFWGIPQKTPQTLLEQWLLNHVWLIIVWDFSSHNIGNHHNPLWRSFIGQYHGTTQGFEHCSMLFHPPW